MSAKLSILSNMVIQIHIKIALKATKLTLEWLQEITLKPPNTLPSKLESLQQKKWSPKDAQ
jgi:hypothetical protein